MSWFQTLKKSIKFLSDHPQSTKTKEDATSQAHDVRLAETAEGHELAQMVGENALIAVPEDVAEFSKKKGSRGVCLSYIRLFTDTPSWQMSLAILSSISAGVPLPIMSYITGEVIDDFGSDEDAVTRKIWILIVIACAYFLLTWTYMYTWSHIGLKNGVRLREKYVKSLLSSEVSKVEGRGAEVSAKLGNSIYQVQTGTGDKAGLLLQSMSYFVAAFVVGFIRNATLTAILIPVVPVFLFIVTIGSRLTSKYNRRIEKIGLDASTFAQETLKNIRLVKSLNSLDVLSEKFREFGDESLKDSVKKAAVGALMTGSIYFSIYSTNALAFWEGGRLIVSNSYSGAGATYVVVSLVIDSSFVVGMVSPFLQIFASAANAGEEIIKEIEDVPAISIADDSGEKIDEDDFRGEVEFKGVSFAYPSAPETLVMSDFSFKFESGSFIGVVGPSGSSKSTTINLIERFYDATAGFIELDGKDIRELNLKSMRRHISLVSQEPVLFDGTIYDNIISGLVKLGKEFTKDEESALVQRAAHASHSDVFIDSLPERYATQVGTNGGAKLSVGQRQRIALARALVSMPKLILLDEATSAVDALSERSIAQALHEDMSATRICVAHRLSTVRHADVILVMGHGGRVMESGSHDELMSIKNGRYAEMIKIQSFSRGKEEEAGEVESVFSENSVSQEKEEFPNTSDSEVSPQANERNSVSLISQIYFNAKLERKWIFLGLLTSFTTGLITVADALLFGNLISAQNQTDRPHYLLSRSSLLAGFFMLVAGVALMAYIANGSAFGYSSIKLTQRMKDTSFAHLLHREVLYFDQERNSAQALASRLDSDAGALGGLSGQFIGTSFSVVTSIVSGVILAHVVAWKIALVLLPAVPLIIVAGFGRLHIVSKNQAKTQGAFDECTSLASEAITNFRTVASLSLENDIYDKYVKILSTTYKDNSTYMLLANSLLAFAYTLPFIVYAFAYWWGSHLVSVGDYSSKQYFIVLPALLFSAQTSGQLFSMAPDFTRARSAAKSIFEDLRSDVEESDLEASVAMTRTLPEPLGRIEFRNVTFCYESREEPVVQDLSFVIEAGRNVAFVGRSGCGKTSIFSLLARFYKPQSGQILLDGMDILDYPLHILRERIGYVPQESMVFTSSVRFNLLLGIVPGAVTEQEIEEACISAQIWDFISSLPQGLDSLISPTSISGGQKQRISLARAFLHQPKVLLLDEPTAALDAQNEKAVDIALKKGSVGRTSIQIAHRLGGIVDSHEIFVFEDGRILDQGKHFDLLSKESGLYADLVASMI